MSSYAVKDGKLLILDPAEKFFTEILTKAPFLVQQDNEYRLIATSATSDAPNAPKENSNVGESSLMIDKSTKEAVRTDVFVHGPVSIERGTCTFIGSNSSGR